ncbi:MAG: DUF4411 family protein [Aquificaceae bacterium]
MVLIYIIDTSSLIEMKDKYPIDVFPTVWKNMGELYANGRLIAPSEVKKEIRDDELKNWIKNKKNMFIAPDRFQTKKLKDILERFPFLAKPDGIGPNADPWLIALALSKKEEISIFNQDYVIITEESKSKQKRIPAVANHYGIECINLIELFKKEGWRF